MNTTLKRFSIAAAALAATLGVSTPANAVFIANICDNITCSGTVVTVTDNGAGDTIPMPGAISFTVAAFGYTLVVNTSQSKPMVGSATAPQLDLSYTATTGLSTPASVFLYASDTDFSASGNFRLSLGGTNSGGDGSVTGRGWGGSSNTVLQFSPANLLAALGPFTDGGFSGAASGSFSPTANPYSLTIGMAITRTTPGTSTGDLNLQVSSVPEPSTWAMLLIGPALIGVVVQRRRRRR